MNNYGGQYNYSEVDQPTDAQRIAALEKRCAESEQKYRLLECDIYEHRDRIGKADRTLESLGYRHCDIAACNCGGYHKWNNDHLASLLKPTMDAIDRAQFALRNPLKVQASLVIEVLDNERQRLEGIIHG